MSASPCDFVIVGGGSAGSALANLWVPELGHWP
jgi:hypothetical protein